MVAYRLEIDDIHAHRLRVTMTLARPARAQRLAMPAWAPGSYMIRDFARHVVRIEARQGARPVPIEQVDKSTWLAHCEGRAALVVTWVLYAFDDSVRAACVDDARVFVNGPAVFLRAVGREGEPHTLALGALPAGWEIATALPSTGVRRFAAAGYAALIDHPLLCGRLWRGRFEVAGVPHEIAVHGAWPTFDGTRLVADLKRLCETVVRFWHGKGRPPFEGYHFLVQATDDGYGGLEHASSTAIACARRSLPRRGVAEAGDAYVGLLSLLGHEYFHAWSVMRIRAPELAAPDLQAEAYTRLLWFYEGFTSYYDELMLLRAGLVDAPRYLRRLAHGIDTVLGAPGHRVQSLAQASFEAWTKYYRRNENTPNVQTSYYDKGALVALLADLALRRRGRTLDAVMRSLWKQSARGPAGEGEIAAALGADVAPEVLRWVHGTAELPLAERLAGAGVAWRRGEPALAVRLGLRLSEGPVTGVQVRQVIDGGAAAAAGVSAGDELIAVAGWRVRRLDDALHWIEPGRPFELLVARDQRLRSLTATLPATAGVGPVTLALDERPAAPALALRHGWLGA